MEEMKKYWKHLSAGAIGFSALSLFYFFNKLKKSSYFYDNEIEIEKKLRPLRKALELPVTLPLTKGEAMFRSSKIENIKYSLLIQLYSEESVSPNKNKYEGLASIDFNLKDFDKLEKNGNLFLDFQGQIKQIIINSHVLENHSCIKNGRIYLESHNLLPGANKIIIKYFNKYSTESNGLRYYIDSEDQVSALKYKFHLKQIESLYLHSIRAFLRAHSISMLRPTKFKGEF